jgi:hypothetical protein
VPRGAGKNKIGRLWSGAMANREEQFMDEMVLSGTGGAEGWRARPDPHFFLDFHLKEPYI